MPLHFLGILTRTAGSQEPINLWNKSYDLPLRSPCKSDALSRNIAGTGRRIFPQKSRKDHLITWQCIDLRTQRDQNPGLPTRIGELRDWGLHAYRVPGTLSTGGWRAGSPAYWEGSATCEHRCACHTNQRRAHIPQHQAGSSAYTGQRRAQVFQHHAGSSASSTSQRRTQISPTRMRPLSMRTQSCRTGSAGRSLE